MVEWEDEPDDADAGSKAAAKAKAAKAAAESAAKAAAKEAIQLDKVAASLARVTKNYEALSLAEQGLAKNQKVLGDSSMKLIKLLQEQLEFSETLTEEQAKYAESLGITAKVGDDAADIMVRLSAAQEKLGFQLEVLDENVKDAADSLFGFLGHGKELIAQQKEQEKKMTLLTERIRQQGIATVLAGKMKGAWLGVLKKAKEGIALLTWEIIAQSLAVDKATASFKKQTGVMDKEYSKRIEETRDKWMAYGVTAEMAAETQAGLVQGFTDFTLVSASARDRLVEVGSVLAAQGVSADAFADSIQTATKMLGQSAEQAAETALELTAFAREIGKAPAMIIKEFGAAAGQLAKFGSTGKQVFKDLQVQSKLTGIAVDRLLDITAKFDTFEGAAESAGRLNAMLGGPYLGAMEMVKETDPTKRFEKMKGALDSAGKSFESMGYYEKQAIANAMGLKDVGELSLVMSGRTDLLAGAAQKSAEEIEKEAQMASDMQDVMTQLKQAFIALAPTMMQFIDILREDIIPLIQKLAPLVQKLAPILIGLFALGKAYSFLKVLGQISGAIFSVGGAAVKGGTALASLGKQTADVTKTVTGGGKAVIDQTKNIKDMGKVSGGAAGGLKKGAVGMQQQAAGNRAMGASINWNLLIFMAGITAMILATGYALKVSDGGKGMIEFATGMAIMIAAFVLAGAALAYSGGTLLVGFEALAFGIALMMASMILAYPVIAVFAELWPTLDPARILEIAGAVGVFGAVVLALGYAATFAGPGLAILGGALSGLTLALAIMQGLGILDNISKMAEGLGLMAKNASNMGTAISALSELPDVLDDIGDHAETLDKLSEAFELLAGTATDAGTAFSAIGDIADLDVKAAVEYKSMIQEAQVASETVVQRGSTMDHMSKMFDNMKDLVEGLENAVGKLDKSFGQKTKQKIEITTKVDLDGRALAESVHEHLAEFT